MTIGVFMNKSYSETGKEIYVVYKAIIDALKAKVIGITSLDDLKLVDGVILQGGDSQLEDLSIVKHLYDLDIPTLGICLGMQKMAMAFNGDLGNVKNHMNNKKYAHNVVIKEESVLYKIIGSNELYVNSRHKNNVLNTDLDVVAYSSDGVIEAVEDKNKTFFLGVQWHPESMITYDEIEQKLFDYFLKKCGGKNEN